jgi:DNA-binding NarL/FixJ family response regulator
MVLQIEDVALVRVPTGTESEPARMSIRILVVDDQRLFRESLAGLLGAEAHFEIVGSAGDGAEAIELARCLLPDVVLMNVKIPRMDGIMALRYLKAELPHTRVILLTTFTSDGYMLEGLVAGADGYLLKDTSAVGLISTIRAVHAGEQVTAPAIANRIMRMLDLQHAGRTQHLDGLSAREMEILILIARGMIAREIARTLTISEKTVRNHISSIYRKLNIYDRSQVVIYAMKKGLVDIQDL